MRWKISSLDPALRQQLGAVGREGSLGGVACFFSRKRRLRALVICTILGALATALGMLVSYLVVVLHDETNLGVKGLVVGLTSLATLWTLLLLVESIRVAGSRIKPFILITPRVLLEAHADHDYLTGYRLRDATDYKTVDNYSGAKYRGRTFSFQFPNGSWSVTLKDAASIRSLEQILAQAQSGALDGDGGLHLLPAEPSLLQSGVRPFTNPFGECWQVVGGVLVLGVLVGFIGRSVYSKWVGRS